MVYNKGINDVDRATSVYRREYRLWEHMLRRCYSDVSLVARPSYANCNVHDEWLLFSKFLKDLPKIPGYDYWYQNPKCGICLDKDILIKGNSIYSLDTCVFVPKSLNSIECRKNHKSFANADNSRSVEVFTKDGECVGSYNSLVECAKDLNLCSGHISKVCMGKRKSHKGYTFKYLK